MPVPLPPLALRTQPFQESVIREMTRLGDETGAVNLSQGLPDYEPPIEVLQAAAAAIMEGENQYTFPFGSLALRQAVAVKLSSYNHIQADPETMITITCGVSEAIMSAVLSLTDPGDEAVILEPWYENYVPACLMAGVTPRFVDLHKPDYRFDPSQLRAAFQPKGSGKVRLVLINTPHNPTGRVFTREELDEIARLCQDYGVIAVTDEIYEHILYDGRQHISLGSLDGMQDRTVTISGLGKSYALTGWRIGWAAAAPELTARIRKVHDYLTICAPAPLQAAGTAALALPTSYYTTMLEGYSARREILVGALHRAGLNHFVPEGAYYIMGDFSQVKWDLHAYQQPGWTRDRSFAEFLAREIGVAVVPGSSFYEQGDQGSSTIRFNFAKRESTLEEAVRRLAWLQKA
jgi:aspartate/methionine/tyrosine aminotransferase